MNIRVTDHSNEDPPQLPFEPAPIDRLGTLDVPTLVVAGERDVPGFLEMADILAARIPGAASHRVSGAGHMVNMEAADAVNTLLEEFLSSAGSKHRSHL